MGQESRQGRASAVLVHDGQWLVGTLTVGGVYDGEVSPCEVLGEVRVRHEAGRLISNFRIPDGDWSNDVEARKVRGLDDATCWHGAAGMANSVLECFHSGGKAILDWLRAMTTSSRTKELRATVSELQDQVAELSARLD